MTAHISVSMHHIVVVVHEGWNCAYGENVFPWLNITIWLGISPSSREILLLQHAITEDQAVL